jgi:hypothetical protein
VGYILDSVFPRLEVGGTTSGSREVIGLASGDGLVAS